jgi:SAM-dependent methyltransferase
MRERFSDGSAGDVNYGTVGRGYARYRQPDPHIAGFIHAALGSARSVLNVGAGAGSYEPAERQVTPVEPSEAMRAQRPTHLAQAIDAVAGNLPFADGQFDAAMATFTVHQWPDLQAGLREVRRVTRGPVVILSCDPDLLDRFWLAEYCPEVIATEARRYPPMERMRVILGRATTVVPVPVPLHCTDGFNEAYYGRPEMLLDPGARLANSAWSFVEPTVVARFEAEFGSALASGTWDKRFGQLRSQSTFIGSLMLVVSPG